MNFGNIVNVFLDDGKLMIVMVIVMMMPRLEILDVINWLGHRDRELESGEERIWRTKLCMGKAQDLCSRTNIGSCSLSAPQARKKEYGESLLHAWAPA